MGKMFNGKERLEIFAFEMIALIAHDKKENIDTIEHEMGKKHVVRYIRDKYHDCMSVTFKEDCCYNLDDWEEELFNLAAWVEGNESRKFGIIKKMMVYYY